MAGFCGGVRNAVMQAEEILEKESNIYCLGELVHNTEVMKSLEEKGLKTIEQIEEADLGASVIFRAHGEPPQTYQKAQERKITIFDLSCPKVLKIHEIVQDYTRQGFYILYIAEKGHPETIGTFGFCGEKATIVSEIDDIEEALKQIRESQSKKVAIVSQTTFSMTKFDTIVEEIKKLLSKDVLLEVNKTICDATRLRQAETEEMAKQFGTMIIIGGKKSSNTQKLYDISKRYCRNVYFIQTVSDLPVEEVKKQEEIGIMAGASTPSYIIDEVKNALES